MGLASGPSIGQSPHSLPPQPPEKQSSVSVCLAALCPASLVWKRPAPPHPSLSGAPAAHPTVSSCPYYCPRPLNHPPLALQLVDNRNCVLCMECLKACPHRWAGVGARTRVQGACGPASLPARATRSGPSASLTPPYLALGTASDALVTLPVPCTALVARWALHAAPSALGAPLRLEGPECHPRALNAIPLNAIRAPVRGAPLPRPAGRSSSGCACRVWTCGPHTSRWWPRSG